MRNTLAALATSLFLVLAPSVQARPPKPPVTYKSPFPVAPPPDLTPKPIIEVKGPSLEKLAEDCNPAKVKRRTRNVRDIRTRCQKDYDKDTNLFDGYKSFIINRKLLKAIHQKNPKTTKLYNIGNTHRNHPILALKLSNSNNYRPSVFVNCAVHASEAISTEYCYQIIDDLLKKQDYLKHFNFWVVPIVNVDGSERYWHENGNGRRNHKGRIINRNFPFMWGNDYYRGPSPASEPETQALMNLFEQENFVFSLSFHAAGSLVIYGYTAHPNKGERVPKEFIATNPEPYLPKKFAEVIKKHSKMGMRLRDSDGFKIKKYKSKQQYYFVGGADQDWFYFKHGTIGLVVEAPFQHSSEDYDYDDCRKVTQGFMSGFWKMLDYYLELPRLTLYVADHQGNLLEAEVKVDEFQYFHGEERVSQNGVRELIFPKEKEYTITVEKNKFKDQFTVTPKKGGTDLLLILDEPLELRE